MLDEYSDSDCDGRASRIWNEAFLTKGDLGLEDEATVNYSRRMNPTDWVYCPPEPKALDDNTSNSDVSEDHCPLNDEEEEE